MARRVHESTVVVVGLGRFGSALALQLMDLDQEVLAIDRNPVLVAQYAPRVTLAVEADATSADVLRDLGVSEVGRAVVAIGTSLEASLLTASALAEVGVPEIWAKAVSARHQQILQKVGATRIVFPEVEMGTRVAHLLSGAGMQEYIEFANGYAISVLEAPNWMVARSVESSKLLGQHRVSCVGLQRAGNDEFEAVAPSTVVRPGDRIVVAGRKENVERFALRG
jgi:trk system potassium uptake protein TrkA